ncbi:MAG: hypothetical protein AAFV27_00495 [Pseudomonadota bacterium]
MDRNPEGTLQKDPWLRRVLLRSTAYVGAYLAGIVACIAFTPAEVLLAGKWLIFIYPWFSVLGFFFLFFGYETLAAEFWYVGWSGLGIVAIGVLSFFRNRPRLVALRPWLLAFPVGFVGTLGAYYTAAASI